MAKTCAATPVTYLAPMAVFRVKVFRNLTILQRTLRRAVTDSQRIINSHVKTMALVQPYKSRNVALALMSFCSVEIGPTMALKKGAYTGQRSDILKQLSRIRTSLTRSSNER